MFCGALESPEADPTAIIRLYGFWIYNVVRLQINLSLRVAASLLLCAAVVITAFAANTYLRDRERYQREYTRTTRQRDIADSARTAVSALQDAALQGQGYVLTGETAYAEGYRKDVGVWQDESGTAGIVSLHDPAAALVRDFTEQGNRTLDELKQTISLYDAGSCDAALDRLRKGAATVYLGQARDTLPEILRIEALGADESDQSFINNGLRIQRRLMEAVACLCGLAIAEFVLLIAGTKRGRHAEAAVEAPSKQSAALA